MTMSYPQMVIDNEIAEMIKFAVGGIVVNDETMSVDVIKEVGYKKDFLAHKNTFLNRKIQSQPKLMDRKNRFRWEEGGNLTALDRATAKAKDLLANYKPEALPDSVLAELEALLVAAEKERAPQV